MSAKATESVLSQGVAQVLPNSASLAKLMSRKKIRLYLGIDPTGSLLTLGHGVVLRKLQQFAELGHEVTLLVGNGTVRIGDPTGRDSTRPVLTDEIIKENFKNWKQQASRILDFKKIKVQYNGDWLDKLKFEDLVHLMGKVTVQQLLERDMFQKRIKEGKPIFGHEIIYPLLQGYDSVAMNVDLEIGGNDQTFNMLMGRTLQKVYNDREKWVLTTPIINGTDGRKMSQSYNNFISISDEPNEMFGKLMSVADDVMLEYYEIFTNEDVTEAKKFIKTDPRNAKVRLAKLIVTWLHDTDAADRAEQDFVTKFVKKETPEEMPEFEVPHDSNALYAVIFEDLKLVSSGGEARRVIEQGGVSIDGKVIKDHYFGVKFSETPIVIKVGKRKFAKVRRKK